MIYNNDDVNEVVVKTDENGKAVSWGLKRVPLEDTEIIEETIVIRKRVKKSTDMDGKCFTQKCAFDNWDWEQHPFAHMYCGCSKCRITF